MNKADSELYASVLKSIGYEASDEQSADIMMVNTCAVRQASVHKMESLIGKWVAMRNKTGKPRRIGVIGCVPAIDIQSFKSNHQQVDFVIGTYPNKDQMIEAMKDTFEFASSINLKTESQVSAYVPITSGCNCFCTYCIVPYTRGLLKSRNEHEVLDEVKNRISNGAVEIVLLGQNVNEFGLDKGDKHGFIKLLERIDSIKGLKRLRFITSHPKDMDDHTIERMSKLDRLAPYFHLPVQSGSDDILRRMARGYSKDQYLHLVKKIREEFPVCAITTDTIVGFPGETEGQFQETLDLMDNVQFDQVFCAMYSPRPKTAAQKMTGRCTSEELHRRINLLLEKQKVIGKRITNNYLNTHTKVLTLSYTDNNTTGINERGRFVEIDGRYPIGNIVNVFIKSVDGRLKGIID